MPQSTSDIVRGVQVEQLNLLFLNRLRQTAEKVYAPLVEDGTVRREEAENELMRYYVGKKSSLQVVYSYYAEQWDYFHQVTSAADSSFLPMLQQARSLFAQLYQPTELNLTFYTEQLSRLATSDVRWQSLRRHFIQKWKRLLSEREYAYQQEHIARLCEDYFRMIRAKMDVLQNKGRMGSTVSPRLAWLQMSQSPEMRDMIEKLVPIIRNNKTIKELNRILGRKKADEERLYQAMAGKTPVELLRPATHSDIVGITEGNNLNALLPVEYCYLSDRDLEDIFIRRYTENKLAVFDSVSRQVQQSEATSRKGRDMDRHLSKGPFVVCVDTSGSMDGERELLAKAIVLSLALLSEHLNRTCRVILFSDQTEVIELRNLYEDLPLLEDFLCRSFHGGSELECAMEVSVQALMREDFRYADLLWISDFEMKPVSPMIAARVEELKRRNLRLYAIGVGNRCEPSYSALADRFMHA